MYQGVLGYVPGCTYSGMSQCVLGYAPVRTRVSREYIPTKHTLANYVLHGRKEKTPIQINQGTPANTHTGHQTPGGAKASDSIIRKNVKSERRASAAGGVDMTHATSYLAVVKLPP